MEFIGALAVERQLCRVAAVRMGAGFPEESLLRSLEERRTPYVAGCATTRCSIGLAQPYLRRAVGRLPVEPRTWYQETTYGWRRGRPSGGWCWWSSSGPGELFLHHWLITNWTPEQRDGQALLEMYRERGTAKGTWAC